MFIKEKNVKKIALESKNYKTFKELTQLWITLEIERSNLIIKMESNEIET